MTRPTPADRGDGIDWGQEWAGVKLVELDSLTHEANQYKLLSGWSEQCWRCGSDLHGPCHPNDDGREVLFEDDDVVCTECGLMHRVSVDEDVARIWSDEDSSLSPDALLGFRAAALREAAEVTP